jgi:hypothetical protein
VRDFALLAGVTLIAVVSSWIGITGIKANGGEPRVLIYCLFCFSVALAAAYLAVGGAALWLLEWLRPERRSAE